MIKTKSSLCGIELIWWNSDRNGGTAYAQMGRFADCRSNGGNAAPDRRQIQISRRNSKETIEHAIRQYPSEHQLPVAHFAGRRPSRRNALPACPSFTSSEFNYFVLFFFHLNKLIVWMCNRIWRISFMVKGWTKMAALSSSVSVRYWKERQCRTRSAAFSSTLSPACRRIWKSFGNGRITRPSTPTSFQTDTREISNSSTGYPNRFDPLSTFSFLFKFDWIELNR